MFRVEGLSLGLKVYYCKVFNIPFFCLVVFMAKGCNFLVLKMVEALRELVQHLKYSKCKMCNSSTYPLLRKPAFLPMVIKLT